MCGREPGLRAAGQGERNTLDHHSQVVPTYQKGRGGDQADERGKNNRSDRVFSLWRWGRRGQDREREREISRRKLRYLHGTAMYMYVCMYVCDRDRVLGRKGPPSSVFVFF